MSLDASAERNRRLFLLDPSGLPARVYTVEVASGRRELWRELVPVDRGYLAADATSRSDSFLSLASDIVGSVSGPVDLSSNRKHRRGYGR